MNAILAESLGIIGCLLISAYFSGSETALTSLSPAQAHQLIEEKGAKSLRLWVQKPISVLTAILIGNNIVNITASALATDLARRILVPTGAGDWAVPAAVGVMTFLLLTFGEITPKTVAKRMYQEWSGPIMSLLKLPYYLFTPFTWFFTQITKGIVKLVGGNIDQKAPFVTAEEIEYMINLGSREGTFSADRERMLRSVFEFTDTLVREVMVPRTDMVAISANMEMGEVLEVLLACGHSRIPVFEETVDNIMGIFYAKDIIQRLASKDNAFDVRQYLRKPFFVPESKRIADLFSEFQRQRMHMAIVVDEFGGTAGLVTLEDIVEEFFGDIQDEYDIEPVQLMEIDLNTLRADARVTIYDIEEYFDIKLPEHPDYETLGGFLMAQLGTVPLPGSELQWDELLFRVLEADEKRVISVEIQRKETEPLQSDGSGEQLVS